MKKTVVLLFLMLICIESYSQANSETLKKSMMALPEDTTKVQKWREAGIAAEQSDKAFARECYRQAIMVSKRIKSLREETLTTIQLAGYFNNNNLFDSAAIAGNTVISLAQKNNDKLSEGRAYNAIGISFNRQSNYKEALKYLLKAAKIFEEINENKRSAMLYANIAAVFAEINETEKGAAYGKKAIEFAIKSKDPEALARSYYNMGAAFAMADDKKSIEYYKKGLPYALKTQNPSMIQQGYYNIANGYYQIGLAKKRMPPEATAYADTSYHWAEKTGNPLNLFFGSNISAQIAINNKQFDKADIYLKTTGESLKSVGSHFRNRIYYSTLALLRNAQGKYKEAYEFRLKQDAYKDSVLNEERLEELKDLEAKYETDKKEKQLKIQEVELKQKTTNNILLIGGIIALSLVSLLVFLNYKNRIKLKNKEIITLQKEKQLTATESIIKGQEEERSRLAKDLHDGLGGILSSLKYSLTSMTGNFIVSEHSGQLFAKALETLETAISEMRRVAHSMMPEALLKFGLKDAIQNFCEGINQHGKLQINFQAYGLENRLEQSVEITIFRIVQELLNNAMKHSEATKVLVQLTKTNETLVLTVEDNGKGFDQKLLEQNKGAGISNIESRVSYLNGQIEIDSQMAVGTSIIIEIPIKKA
jgi:two-component system NarL family sensor kinase